MHPKSEDNTATIQTDQSYSLNKIVAIANNDVITQLELNKQLLQAKAALEAQSIPAPNELILEKQVLNQMIIQS